MQLQSNLVQAMINIGIKYPLKVCKLLPNILMPTHHVPIDIEGKTIGESSDAQARGLESHFIQMWITLPAPAMYIMQGFLSHSCTRQPGNEAVVWYAFVRSWLKQLHFCLYKLVLRVCLKCLYKKPTVPTACCMYKLSHLEVCISAFMYVVYRST